MKFDEFTPKPKGIEVDVSGICEECFHQIETSIFSKENMTLTMTCEQGHTYVVKSEIDWSFYGKQ